MSTLPHPVTASARVAAVNVRRLRDLAGLTQASLAARAGCSRPLIAQVELAARNPVLPLLEAIASALGTDVAALLTDPGKLPCWHCRDQPLPGYLCLACRRQERAA